MASLKLTKLELRIMEALWNAGPCSVREIQETFPQPDGPAYTTIQTMVYRLEGKSAVRRAKKISNAHIFEAVISRSAAQGRLIDEILGMFGKLTLEDVKEAEETLRTLTNKEASK
jgi:BlaI family transcriptional regulator, penicillinase repressor